jgi:hypothetical protein
MLSVFGNTELTSTNVTVAFQSMIRGQNSDKKWNCIECLVPNALENKNCVCCSFARPGIIASCSTEGLVAHPSPKRILRSKSQQLTQSKFCTSEALTNPSYNKRVI